jgi:hypothetical protein
VSRQRDTLFAEQFRLSSERRGEEAGREHTYERPALHYSIT